DDIAARGGPVLDGPALAGERAAILGLTRGGRTSAGGACRLVRAADGWLAVNLPRPTDVELLPAWLESDAADWEAVVAGHSVAELDARAALLGLPVAVPGSVTKGPLVRRPRAEWAPGPGRPAAGLRVVDLSALWAGPLCASILGLAGAEVIKVEDPRRPDGGRLGPPAFYDLLHADHRSVALDIRSPVLVDLLRTADVVLESSRPRALEQLGIDREAIAAETGCVWVSISGRGLDGDERNRPAFGDDAAVAGGLVAIDPDDGGPLFCADALADPVTGLVAAGLALQALLDGGPWIVDAGLARCAAALAGPPAEALPDIAPPRARAPWGVAALMGADTDEVLARVG
ncbi:MAG: L-carnitine dehydratase/bile acid-inducible protein, partial [Acidimicrobiales bacterium]|nr:L-carnitine dehydratase/bile acid-inducible protein [Acidimicrobiales bacterium]